MRRALCVGIDLYPFGPLRGCVSDAERMVQLLSRHEDGTPNFASIAAVPAGLELLGEIGLANVKRRVGQLTVHLLAELASLRHPDGHAMTRVYGPTNNHARGGTVAFNVLDRFGRAVPYQQVERVALERGVSIRGGCFCNPGAAERAFGFPAGESAACMERARREGFSVEKFGECLGGSVAVGRCGRRSGSRRTKPTLRG